ncbi:DUF4974 domain-containing protein [Pedobacter chinensis]|uniref:DUF4974 domain-containing protein n=1 Tax=Pedobacter chinensis TaxID=2282421 RepID=A0A369Q434_9SPHI|nr:FecR domain-containing protein [Pedobacter chinensis]RDC58235.1 DUF4974 domain-containing protein [Pedobacter chinensis]
MKLNKADFDQILQRYFKGQASQQEIDLLHAYYKSFEASTGFTEHLSDEEKLALENRLQNQINQKIDEVKPKKGKYFKFFKYAAAVLICGVFTITYLIYNTSKSHKQDLSQIAKKENIKDANAIILRLANGKEVSLDHALPKPIMESGTAINSEKAGELVYQDEEPNTLAQQLYHEIIIPPGKQFKVTLPDGTNVWLNASSSLKYPVAFAANERRVELIGEGYFQVSKNKSRPFIVQSKESEIRVTGTEFNIAAYTDQSEVRTTLVEGRVDITFAKENIKLMPGEESVSNLTNQRILKSSVDVDPVIAWKSGCFIFDEPLRDVMKKLSRWYGIPIEVSGDIKNSMVAGKFSQKRTLTQILTYIGELKNFSHTKVGNKIILKKN